MKGDLTIKISGAKAVERSIEMRSSSVRFIILLCCFLFIFACNPSRWDKATVIQFGENGQEIARWENVTIQAMPSRFARWVRFKTCDGKIITLDTAHRIEYQ